jgi:hypothetical protein
LFVNISADGRNNVIERRMRHAIVRGNAQAQHGRFSCDTVVIAQIARLGDVDRLLEEQRSIQANVARQSIDAVEQASPLDGVDVVEATQQLAGVAQAHGAIGDTFSVEVALAECRGRNTKCQLRAIVFDAVVPAEVAAHQGTPLFDAMVKWRTVVGLRTAEIYWDVRMTTNEVDVTANVLESAVWFEQQ